MDSSAATRSISFGVLVLILLNLPSAIADVKTAECAQELVKRAYTVNQYIAKARDKMDSVRKTEPAPQFVSRTREDVERFGEHGPLAFSALMPEGTRYVSTPDPNSEHPVMAHRMSPGDAGALRITVPHPRNPKIKTTSFVYFYNFNLPKRNKDQAYLVDSRIKSVFYHIHGGGTPSAVAMNASDTANWLIRHGYPLIAVTQPGHGDATREIFTPEELENWNLQIISQLVDPSVKVVMSGHSWGGQILLMAHRNSHQPKFKQVAGFVLGAPPIDITLGKGVTERMRAEEELNKKLEQIARGEIPDSEGLQHRSSRDDMKFLANVVINGKLNPVGTWNTTMTSINYSMSILPKEQREKLKPACVFMGRNDALCYVGREKAGMEYFRRMIGLENVVLFGKGKTFKGKQEQTGHQYMDNMLRLQDGTEVHEAYYRTVKMAQEKMGAEPFKIEETKGRPGASADTLIRHAWLLYQNNLAFRQYLADGRSVIKHETERVQFLKAPAERQKDAIKKFQALKGNLERKKREDLEAFARAEYKAIKVQTHSEFASDPLLGGLKSAKRELMVDFSLERKKALQDFIQRAQEVLDSGDFSALETAIKAKKDIFTAELRSRKGKSFEVDEPFELAWQIFKIEIYLGKDKSKWTDAVARQIGFTDVNTVAAVWDKYLEQTALKNKKSKALDQKTVNMLAAADFFSQEFKRMRKDQSRNFQNELMQKFASLNPPAGIREPKEAKWELNLHNLTEEERRSRYGTTVWSMVSSGFSKPVTDGVLPKFIAEFPERLKAKEAELDATIRAEIAAFPWPYGITSEEDAGRRVEYLDEIYKGNFLGGNKDPQAQELVKQINSLQKSEIELETEIKKVGEKIAETEKVRSRTVSEFAKMVSLEMTYTDKPTITYSDPRVTDLESKFWKTAEELTHINAKLHKMQEHLLLRGASSPLDNALALSDLTALEDEFLAKQKKLDEERRELVMAKALAIFEGRYQAEGDKEGRKAGELLRKLVGDRESILTGVLGTDSLEYQMWQLRSKMEELRDRQLQARFNEDSLRLKLMEFMPKQGSYLSLEQIEWGNLVSTMDYGQFRSWLMDEKRGEVRRREFADFLNQWQSAWAQDVISDRDRKKLDWYSVEQKGDATPALVIN